MSRKSLRDLIIAAMFLSIGLILPFFTGQIPQIGKMLLPMHIPVLLCGIVLGWRYGLIVGAILPVMRSLIFSAPLFYPNAVAMAFELATYGLVVGIVYHAFKKQSIPKLYISLITAMICGRIVWGVAEAILLGVGGSGFTFAAFISGALLDAIPGIAIQLVLIPALVFALDRARLVRFKR